MKKKDILHDFLNDFMNNLPDGNIRDGAFEFMLTRALFRYVPFKTLVVEGDVVGKMVDVYYIDENGEEQAITMEVTDKTSEELAILN